MKLLFPIFAGLMLQHQVNTEYFGLRRCLMGFGRCKDHCAAGEKEIQTCKKKKCCAGPKVVQMIKNYMQNEMSHTLEANSQEHLQATKNPDAVIQTKYPILPLLPATKSVSPFASVNTLLIPNATTVDSATTSPTISWKFTDTATSAKSDTTESSDVASDSSPPTPPP
ncbi:beta-defensin 129 [Suricata suricatta]|uniref:Beta-defensin n=1 Tax=Suricata suricatta TaxID=37032 RepID=A0A673UCZ7_SURSU|nr:beta-defensin 129 [Suricata suricatta]